MNTDLPNTGSAERFPHRSMSRQVGRSGGSDGVWARREKVNTYLHESKYDTIATMLAHYDTLIEKIDSAAFKNFKDYATAYAGWMQTDSSIMRLSGSNLATLKQLATTDEHKRGANMARNALNFFYDSLYFTPAYLPEQQYNKKGDDDINVAEATETKTAKMHPTIKLYPNPANSTVTIEYKAISDNSKLFITDMLGVLYETKPLIGEQGKEIVNVSHYTNGVYLARIVTDEADLLKSKFVILK
ncbi:MAG: T9SS type A sorting domain-containing protein [Chitinophagales bacterium]|nr:T9SS type A sorting domain-containing protein [Chitinophagales bacterium]